MHRVSLDPEAVERLIKLLGMLGSAHDGERAAAGLKAHEFLKQCGLQWADVIRLPIEYREADDHGAHDDHDVVGWRMRREFCLRHPERLTAKELGFLDSLRTWRGPLTERQQAWIDGIFARVRGRAT